MTGSAPEPSNSASDKPSYPIGSVDTAFRLLRSLAQRDQMRIGEAASELGVSPSTAHRLMQMLVYHGLARQEPEGKAYMAGPELISLGLNVMRRLDVPAVARPLMDELAARFRETVHLFALQPRGVVLCVESVESPHALRVGSRKGTLLSAFASSSGRAILATMPEDEVKSLYPSRRLPVVQPNTIRSRAELLDRLETVREVGYAAQTDESEPGVSAVSAPVRLGDDVATLALTIALPTFRVEPGLMPQLGDAVLLAAGTIASRLGT